MFELETQVFGVATIPATWCYGLYLRYARFWPPSLPAPPRAPGELFLDAAVLLSRKTVGASNHNPLWPTMADVVT
jgi:hypothetical protein